MKGNTIKMVKYVSKALQSSRARLFTLCCVVGCVVLGAVPTFALATSESEGAKAVKEAATKVSEEGQTIIIAVLTGLVALIALAIILPKAIGFIRRFI